MVRRSHLIVLTVADIERLSRGRCTVSTHLYATIILVVCVVYVLMDTGCEFERMKVYVCTHTHTHTHTLVVS